MSIDRFEYDQQKSRANRECHGVGLEEAEALWQNEHLIVSARNVFGENRWCILGKMSGKLYVAVFTYRADVIRLISFHRADKRLKRRYATYIHEKEKH